MLGGRLDRSVQSRGAVLVDREHQRRLLDCLCVTVSQRGGALLLHGEPGMGKTALLDYVAASTAGARPRVRLLRARGVQGEATLPFATLADLLLPLREHFRDIPRAQRTAIEACLALVEESSPSPYAVCVATLNVLIAAGEAAPTIVLVDDLEWADPPSQRALLFVARRLSTERVAMVLAVRADHLDLGVRHGVPLVEVGGLTGPACAELLRQRGFDIAPDVLGDLVRVTGGNPSALLELASSSRAAQLRGDEPMVLPLRAAQPPGPARPGHSLIMSGRVSEGRSSLIEAGDALAAVLGVAALAYGEALTRFDAAETARPRVSDTLNLLTPQELQVARAVAGGMNNIEAANALFVSRKTIEAHLTRAYRKLGLRSRTDLTRLMVSEGLLD